MRLIIFLAILSLISCNDPSEDVGEINFKYSYSSSTLPTRLFIDMDYDKVKKGVVKLSNGSYIRFNQDLVFTEFINFPIFKEGTYSLDYEIETSNGIILKDNLIIESPPQPTVFQLSKILRFDELENPQVFNVEIEKIKILRTHNSGERTEKEISIPSYEIESTSGDIIFNSPIELDMSGYTQDLTVTNSEIHIYLTYPLTHENPLFQEKDILIFSDYRFYDGIIGHIDTAFYDNRELQTYQSFITGFVFISAIQIF